MFLRCGCYRSEGSVVTKFCFHAVLSSRNSGVVRTAAAFPDFTRCKRGVAPAQETIQALLGGDLGLGQQNISKCPKAPPDSRVNGSHVTARAAG